MKTRTNLLISENLITEIDKLTGPRKRSEFFENAVKERLAKLRFEKAAEGAFGVFKNYSEFSTRKKVISYIRKVRRENSYRI